MLSKLIFLHLLASSISFCSATEITLEFVDGTLHPGHDKQALVSDLAWKEASPLGGQIVIGWPGDKAGLDGNFFFPVEEKHDEAHGTVDRIVVARGKFDLLAGRHRVTPGGLNFVVGGMRVTEVESPLKLDPEEDRISVSCFPLEWKAVDSASGRRVRFDLRLSENQVEFSGGSDLLGLTYWLPPTGKGCSYRAEVSVPNDASLRFRFTLGPQGVALDDASNVSGVKAEGFRLKVEFPGARHAGASDAAEARWLNPPENPDEATDLRKKFRVFVDRPYFTTGEPLVVCATLKIAMESDPAFQWLGLYPEPEFLEFPKAEVDPLSEKDPVQRRYRVPPPSGKPGPYRLRVFLRPRGRPVTWEMEAVLAMLPREEREGSLSLFTDRNRLDYLEGETVEFTLLARGRVPEGRGYFELSGPRAASMRLPLEFAMGKTRPETQTFRLDTTLLAAGEYTLTARMGEWSSPALPLRLAPLVRKTHFDIAEWHQYGGEGSLLLDTPAIERLAEMGYNTIAGNLSWNDLGLPYDREDIGWSNHLRSWNEEVMRLCQGADSLPAPESFYMPNIIERSFHDSLRYGIGLLANIFGNGRGMVLPFAIPEDENERRRIMSLWALQLHPYSNLLGFIYCCGDAAMPPGWDLGYAGFASTDLRLGERMRILRESFEKEKGPIGDLGRPVVVQAEETDVNNALGALYTRALAQEKGTVDLNAAATAAERRRLWSFHSNRVWMDTFTDLKRYAAEFDPSLLVTCGSTFNSEARGGLWFPLWYQNQDLRVNSRCTDYGVYVNHMMGYTDFMRVGMSDDGVLWTPVRLWEHRLQCNPTVAFRDQVAGISRGATGGGLWESGYQDGRNLSRSGAEVALQNNALMERYGDLFLALARRDDIALLHSFHECAIVGETYNHVHLAHYVLTRLGYMVRIVDENELTAGKLGGAKALFLIHHHVDLPPEVRKTIEAFQARGGLVLADSDTTVNWPGIRRVPVNFPTQQVKVDGGNEYIAYYQVARQHAAALRAALLPAVSPVARLPARDDLHFSFGRLAYGDSAYVFCMNDSSPFGDVVEQFPVLPVSTTLEVECGDAAVYDLLAGVKMQPEGDGPWRRIPGDFTACPARIYALLPEELGSLELAAPEKAPCGTAVPISCRAMGRSGKALDIALPIEVTLTSGEGHTRYHLFRAIRGQFLEPLKFGINDLPGLYTLRIQELLTGLTVEASLELLPPAAGETAVRPALPADALKPLGPVIVFGSQAIRECLHSGQPYTLLLDPIQKQLLPEADALAAALRKSGAAVALRFYDELEFREFPMQWDYKLEDLDRKNAVLSGQFIGYRVRGKNHLGDYRTDGIQYNFYTNYSSSPPWAVNYNLILLGSHGQNRLLDNLHKENLFTRKLTLNYPGPGKGLIQLARSPFFFGKHAIGVMANDDAGLRAAMDALGRFGEEAFNDGPAMRRPRLLPGRMHLKNQPQVTGLPRAEAAARPVASQRREPFVRLADRFGAWVESFDVGGGRLMAGVKSWGNNLVVADLSGHVQWARKTSVTAWQGPWYIIDQAGRGHLLDDGRIALDSEFTVLLDPSGKPLLRTPCRAAARFLPDGSCYYAAPMEPLAIFGSMGYNALVVYGADQRFKWAYDSRKLYQSADEHLRKRSASTIVPLPGDRLAALFSMGAPFFQDQLQNDALLIFDRASGKVLSRLGHASIEQIGVSPNGEFLAISHRRPPRATGGTPLELFHFEGQRLAQANIPSAAQKIAIDDQGRSLFIHLQGVFPGLYRLDVRDTAGPAILRRLDVGGRFINDFTIDAPGEQIAAATLDGWLIGMDREGKVLWQRDLGAVVTMLRRFGRGDRLMISTASGRILTFDLKGNELSRLDLTPSVVLTTEERTQGIQSVGDLQALGPPADLGRRPGFLETLPKAVEVSANLMADGPKELRVGPGEAKSIRLPRSDAGRTYVLVFDYENAAGGELTIELKGAPDQSDAAAAAVGGSEVGGGGLGSDLRI